MNDRDCEWIGWHFLRVCGRLRHGDGRKPEVGVPLRVEGPVEPGRRGLHASRRAIDAIEQAPGPIVCRVVLRDGIVDDGRVSVARERTILAMADATDVLTEFAIRCAESVIHHLPDRVAELYRRAFSVKRAWLAGEASLAQLAAAGSAANSAVWDAAGSAANSAARAAARAAASSAVWDAVRAAASSAASSAANSAVWDAQEAMLSAMLAELLGEVRS